MKRELTDEELLDFVDILEGYSRSVYDSICSARQQFEANPDRKTRMDFYHATLRAGGLLSTVKGLKLAIKKYRSKENALPTVPE
jgi:hypothetical protein